MDEEGVKVRMAHMPWPSLRRSRKVKRSVPTSVNGTIVLKSQNKLTFIVTTKVM